MIFVLRALSITFLLSLVLVTPTHAQEAGLLLGLRSEIKGAERPEVYMPESESKYFTVWIYPDGDTYRYARGPNLLLPRSDGFWEVGVIRQDQKTWVEDHLYANPVGANSPKAFEAPASRSGNITRKIDYVGPQGVSVATHSHGHKEGDAEPWDDRSLQTLEIGELSRSIPIETFFGPQAMSTVEEGFDAYIEQFPDLLNALESKTKPVSWGLYRRKGKWKVGGFRDHGTDAFRGGFAGFPVRLEAPTELVAHHGLTVLFSDIEEKVPGAVDAFQGPDGKPLVIVTKDHLLVYTDRTMTHSPLTVDLGEQAEVVMSEWASGSYIPKWTKSVMDFIGADI